MIKLPTSCGSGMSGMAGWWQAFRPYQTSMFILGVIWLPALSDRFVWDRGKCVCKVFSCFCNEFAILHFKNKLWFPWSCQMHQGLDYRVIVSDVTLLTKSHTTFRMNITTLIQKMSWWNNFAKLVWVSPGTPSLHKTRLNYQRRSAPQSNSSKILLSVAKTFSILCPSSLVR